jgi:nicotinic acid mononucleotide adenylyltransferase
MKYPHVYLRKTQNLVDISSTKIRALINEYYKTKDIEIFKELIKYVNQNALRYIIKNKLYDRI